MKRDAYRALLRHIREMEKDEGRTVADIAIEEVPLPDGDIQLRVDCSLEAPERKAGGGKGRNNG